VDTRIPPDGEDPVRVRTEIRWRNATATVAIPEVFCYSTGIYIPVTYRTLPARPRLAGRRRTKKNSGRQHSRSAGCGLQPLVQQITVNGIRAEPSHFRSDNRWFTFTARVWIEAGGPQDALHVQLNRPEFPGAGATIAYPPPGTLTAPAPSVPQSWSERGKNWGQTTTVLRSSGADPVIIGQPSEEQP
jgi:hypothetical protein